MIANKNNPPLNTIEYDSITLLPKIDLKSLDLKNYKILNELNFESLPTTANWQATSEFHKNRSRKVYKSKDDKYIIKIWQKNYPATKYFLEAIKAKFYNKIAKIIALIFDDNQECRGYISPVFADRNFNREIWNSYKINLEIGNIGVKIFSSYRVQPEIYKFFFNQLIANINSSHFFYPDFCPDNVAFDQKENKMYLIDLEDVQPIQNINDELIKKVYFDYNPHDYLELIRLVNKGIIN